MIALKAANRDFLLTAPQTVFNAHAQVARRNRMLITCNTSGAHHVEYVVCHVVRIDSSATKFDSTYIRFILALFYWLKPLTDEGEEETGVPRENP